MKELYHKTCLRCGRKLKKMEHRIRGYGDVCWKKMLKDKKKVKLF